MDLNKINSVAQRVRLEIKKVADLGIHDTFVVSAVKEVKTQFGPKVVLILDDEFKIYLPNNLQIFFLEEAPDQLTALKTHADCGDLVVEHLGDRKLEFIIRHNIAYYEELSQF